MYFRRAFLYYLSAFAIVFGGFRYGDWADRAARMMDDRGSVEAGTD
jgi:hypothetical protein